MKVRKTQEMMLNWVSFF